MINASEMGKIGGRRSADKRFLGMTKKQISEHMRNVRLFKKEDNKNLVKWLVDSEQIKP